MVTGNGAYEIRLRITLECGFNLKDENRKIPTDYTRPPTSESAAKKAQVCQGSISRNSMVALSQVSCQAHHQTRLVPSTLARVVEPISIEKNTTSGKNMLSAYVSEGIE